MDRHRGTGRFPVAVPAFESCRNLPRLIAQFVRLSLVALLQFIRLVVHGIQPLAQARLMFRERVVTLFDRAVEIVSVALRASPLSSGSGSRRRVDESELATVAVCGHRDEVHARLTHPEGIHGIGHGRSVTPRSDSPPGGRQGDVKEPRAARFNPRSDSDRFLRSGTTGCELLRRPLADVGL